MSENNIHYKILWLLTYNFRVDNNLPISSASFREDLKFSRWDINLFLYYVEQTLGLQLNKGLEIEVDNVNQLVDLILNETMKSQSRRNENFALAS